MVLVLNDLETRRFGVVCARIDGQGAQWPDLREVNREAEAQGVAMISTRVDAGALDRVHALEDDGYRLMDTLVFYRRSLKNLPPLRPLPEYVNIRLATPDDASAVENVARAGFQGYFGHYHADIRLDNAAADTAYVEWAATSTSQTSTTTPALVALKAEEIAGFITLRLHTAGNNEIVLNAVHPRHQGKGIYTHLLEQALRLCATGPATHVFVSTQINNYNVQRIWSHLGFVHERSCYTFHKWMK